MGKKESNSKQPSFKKEAAKEVSFKGVGSLKIHQQFFNFIKFVLGILLLPIVYSITFSFIKELSNLDKLLISAFIKGCLAYLVIHLFIWEPDIIYKKGQDIVEFIFQFFSPLMKIAPYIVPVYTIIVLLAFGLFNLLYKTDLVSIFMFWISFSFCFHLLLTAKALKDKGRNALKADYIFGFSMVYILNLIFLGLCLNFIFLDFSFVNFINQSYLGIEKIYFVFLNQLFGVK